MGWKMPSEGIFWKLLTLSHVPKTRWDVFGHFCPMGIYTMVCYWKWPFIVSFPIKNFAWWEFLGIRHRWRKQTQATALPLCGLSQSTCGDFLCMLILGFISPGKKVVGWTYSHDFVSPDESPDEFPILGWLNPKVEIFHVCCWRLIFFQTEISALVVWYTQ